MIKQNKITYPTDIFVDNGKGKKAQAAAIIFSFIAHFFLIHLFLNFDQNKKVYKPKEIILVKIAPLFAPVVYNEIKEDTKKKGINKFKKKLLKQRSLNRVMKSEPGFKGLLSKNIEKFSLKATDKKTVYLNAQNNNLRNPKPYDINQRGKSKLFSQKFKNSIITNSLKELLGNANIEFAKEKNDLIVSTFQKGTIHKYPYGVDGDNIKNYGGKAFEKRKGFDIVPWARKTVAKIKKCWTIPQCLNPGVKGEVGVSVVFNKGGSIKSLKINHSSSNQAFNQAAKNALNLANPFYPLPKEILENKLKSYLVFNYNLSRELKKEKNNYMELGAIKDINPFIKRIGLVRNKSFEGTVLPDNLFLGIESIEKVFYKVLYGKKILSGGELSKGFNIVKIQDEQLFSKNYTYEYYLEIMNNKQRYKNVFFIDVKFIKPENSGRVDKKVKNQGYGIAMFLENQLIVYHQKSIPYSPLTKIDRILRDRKMEMSGSPDPFDITGEKKYKQLNMPILGMLVLGFNKLIKPIIKKRDRKDFTYKRLSGTFLRKNIEGLMQPIEIVLALRNK